MTDGINVEQFFFTGNQQPDYVLIRAYVGKLPPPRVKTYLDNLRTNLKLCRTLDELDIGFDVVGVRDDGSRVKPTNNITKVTEGHDTNLDSISKMAQEFLLKKPGTKAKAADGESKFDAAMKIVAD